MSTAQHAPWRAEFKAKLGSAVIVGANGAHIATVHLPTQGTLIAAAPELLSACRGLLAIAETGVSSLGAIRAARAAIARATGEG
jgi:hypothetical protein